METQRTKKYSVVHFIKENSLEVIPTKWINDECNSCLFPKVSKSKLFTLVRKNATSSPSWEPYDIVVKSVSNSFRKAARQANDLQFTSTIETSSDTSVDDDYFETRKRKSKPSPKLLQGLESTVAKNTRGKIITKEPKEIDSSSSEDGLGLNFPEKNSLVPIFQRPFPKDCTVSVEPLEASSSEEVEKLKLPKAGPSSAGGLLSLKNPSAAKIRERSNCTEIENPLSEALESLNNEFRRFQEVVVKDLKDIKADLDIIRSSVVRQNLTSKPRCRFRIPLTSDDDLDSAEEILSEDTEAFQAWCVSVGGVTADAHIRRILTRVFAHEYSLQFNFTGKCGKKKSYNKLAISAVVTSAVVDSHTVTEAEVEEVSANFFRYAKDRNGGRSKRMKK